MLVALFLLVLATSVLVLILLAVVVVGIRQEPPGAELSSRAPSPITAIVRRMLGVYVRRPDSSTDADRRGTCLAGHATGRGKEGKDR